MAMMKTVATTKLTKKVQAQINDATQKGLNRIPVSILDLSKIAAVAKAAYLRGDDVASAVRTYALTITTDAALRVNG